MIYWWNAEQCITSIKSAEHSLFIDCFPKTLNTSTHELRGDFRRISITYKHIHQRAQPKTHRWWKTSCVHLQCLLFKMTVKQVCARQPWGHAHVVSFLQHQSCLSFSCWRLKELQSDYSSVYQAGSIREGATVYTHTSILISASSELALWSGHTHTQSQNVFMWNAPSEI